MASGFLLTRPSRTLRRRGLRNSSSRSSVRDFLPDVISRKHHAVAAHATNTASGTKSANFTRSARITASHLDVDDFADHQGADQSAGKGPRRPFSYPAGR